MIIKTTHHVVQVGTESTLLLPPNKRRAYLLIQNVSDTDIFLSFGGDADCCG